MAKAKAKPKKEVKKKPAAKKKEEKKPSPRNYGNRTVII